MSTDKDCIHSACADLEATLVRIYENGTNEEYQCFVGIMMNLSTMALDAMPVDEWKPNPGKLPKGATWIDYKTNDGHYHDCSYAPGLSWDRYGLPWDTKEWRHHRSRVCTTVNTVGAE